MNYFVNYSVGCHMSPKMRRSSSLHLCWALGGSFLGYLLCWSGWCLCLLRCSSWRFGLLSRWALGLLLSCGSTLKGCQSTEVVGERHWSAGWGPESLICTWGCILWRNSLYLIACWNNSIIVVDAIPVDVDWQLSSVTCFG